MSKIIIILGPTASGKSAVAIRIAQEFGGEIISADSRQIYRGLDIGSGKVPRDISRAIFNFLPEGISPEQKFSIFKQEDGFYSERILHHLIDVAEPMEDFNISHFQPQASEAIEKILTKGKIPIICGGTGFWIDSITHDSQIPEVAPNEKLRAILETKTLEELFEILEEKDLERAKTIDAKNKVRLIRAIEICEALGLVPKIQDARNNNQNNKYEFLEIGLKTEREELNAKIKKRLNDRFNDGMIEEVKYLNKNGVSFEWLERIGLEYRWISRYLQGKVSLKEMQEKLYYAIIHYAKRQMTWFKRNENIIWLKDYTEIKKEVEKFLG